MTDATEVATATEQEIRELPVTGDPAMRTPRSAIERPATGRDLEVYLELDVSGSNTELVTASTTRTKTDLICDVLPLVVGALEADDAQAAEEQAGGSSDKGGVRTFAFSHNLPFEFEPGEDESDDSRDLGDVNTANIEEKIKQIRTLINEMGQTFIMPAIKAAEVAYQAEFASTDSPHYKPLRSRPAQEHLVITDGKLNDGPEFEKWLATADETCVIAVAVIGEGPGHEKAVSHYQELAAKNAYLTCVALTGVSDPTEVALDLRLLSGTAPAS